MRVTFKWPLLKDVLRLILVLLFVYLVFPSPLDGSTWLPLHLTIAVVTLSLAIAVVKGPSGSGFLRTSLIFNLALCGVAGAAVKIGIGYADYAPLIFFVGFPGKDV